MAVHARSSALPSPWPCRARRGSLEQLVHLGIVRLLEVLVPETNRVERVRHVEAHDLLHQRGHRCTGLARSHGNGDDDLARTLPAKRGDCGAHRRSGGQAVVDEDDNVILDCWKGTVVAIEPLASVELEKLAS